MPHLLLAAWLLGALGGSPDVGIAPGGGFPPQAAAPPVSVEEGYRVFLLTMDQGDEVWEQFGHNAILIRDPDGRELVWNWGLFDFQDVDFIPRFLRGTMRYAMGPAETEPFLSSYVRANRSIYANEIFLDPHEARGLDEFVRWNFLPENRTYTYHYFLDNCSTRLRDALDGILDGLLAERLLDRETDATFRDHSRRLVQGTLWVDQGLSFLLGARGDRPITEWEATFVPMELMELLEEIRRPDGAGGTRPLLGPRDTIFLANRPPTPAEPPSFSLLWLLGGIAAGVGVVGLGASSARGRSWATVGLGTVVVVWGLGTGALGILLVGAWFTDHNFIQWNLNLLYLSPLGPVLAVVAVTALAGGNPRATPAARLAAGLAVLIAALTAATAFLQLTPLLTQGNGEVMALAFPVNLALAWSLLAVRGEAPAQPAPARRSSA